MENLREGIFIDCDTGKAYPVKCMPDNPKEMEKGCYYSTVDHVYKYIGRVVSRKRVPPGSVYLWDEDLCITGFDDEEQSLRFDTFNIVSEAQYEDIMNWKNRKMEDTVEQYLNEYSTNLVEQNRNKLLNTGDVFVPELKETDDPMERVIKLTVLNMKLKLNERRGTFDKEYSLDNLRSALNGATKNMSILKFLMWCELLNLDWEFSLINTEENVFHPLPEPIVITKGQPVEVDIPEEVKKGIFNVPIVEGDDPLKKLIKIAIFKKVVYLRDYKQKGTTAHLINNMRSGLKGKQKMSIPCAMNWCEILDMILTIKVTNPATGVWYKSVGYDMYTNVPNDENATFIEEKG